MAKRSGFQITLRAFIAAEAFDSESLRSAQGATLALHKAAANLGFRNISIEKKPRQRVEVEEEAQVMRPSEAEQPDRISVGGNGATGPAVGTTDDPLALPPHLDRRAKA